MPEEGKVEETSSLSKLEAPDSRDSIRSDEPVESLNPSEVEIPQEVVNSGEEITDVTNEQEPISAEEQGKKIKWDCGQHFSDRSDQNTANSPGVQDSENPIQSTSQENSDPPPATDAAPSPPMRNRCTYGSRCYRYLLRV